MYIGKIQSDSATSALILALADSDNDVQKEAIKQLDARTLDDKHLPDFQKLFSNSNWTVRLAALKFVGKLNTPKATALIIPILSDSDTDVFTLAKARLNGRDFNENHIDLLGVQLNATNWSTRKEAARLLGTTSSQKALDLLRDRLEVETDSDVVEEIKKSIKLIRARKK